MQETKKKAEKKNDIEASTLLSHVKAAFSLSVAVSLHTHSDSLGISDSEPERLYPETTWPS